MLRLSLQVLADAQFMDMVFSDTGDLHGGFYDNNGGLVRLTASAFRSDFPPDISPHPASRPHSLGGCLVFDVAC